MRSMQLGGWTGVATLAAGLRGLLSQPSEMPPGADGAGLCRDGADRVRVWRQPGASRVCVEREGLYGPRSGA